MGRAVPLVLTRGQAGGAVGYGGLVVVVGRLSLLGGRRPAAAAAGGGGWLGRALALVFSRGQAGGAVVGLVPGSLLSPLRLQLACCFRRPAGSRGECRALERASRHRSSGLAFVAPPLRGVEVNYDPPLPLPREVKQ